MVTEGLAALSMGRLARELAIKPPSLYKHFAGKDELLAHLTADALVEQTQALERAEPNLLAQARAYRQFALEHPQLYRLMTERPLPRESLPDGLEANAAQMLVGALGPDLGRAAWAFAHGMVELELDDRFAPGANLEAAWQAGVDAFLQAAHPTPTGRSEHESRR
jgi:AcrR family transcriptional regulator